VAEGASAEISVPVHPVDLAQSPDFARKLMAATAF
jgi:hypothetical protein